MNCRKPLILLTGCPFPLGYFIVMFCNYDINMTRWIMAIVTLADKRTGITYAYETQYFRDKEKQQSRANAYVSERLIP